MPLQDTKYFLLAAAAVGLFDWTGDRIRIDSAQNATVLLLAGEPIDEPIVVMGLSLWNNAEEIRQVSADCDCGL